MSPTEHLTTDPLPLDLNRPEFDPPDCPSWAKHDVPGWVRRYCGRNGLPPVYRRRGGVIAPSVRGLDRYQANQFIVYRPETSEYLYHEYTPAQVSYVPGTLPGIERLAGELTAGCRTQTQMVEQLLRHGVSRVKHPDMPPCGPDVAPDRNADYEQLLASGVGWCNEQARVFIRLCQASGIQARLVHLFYCDTETGHTVAECHVDGRWCMADASWFCMFPGPDGKYLSAAECHDRGEGQRYCGESYDRRFKQLLAMTDAQLNFGWRRTAAQWRAQMQSKTAKDHAEHLYQFGIINHPLPC